MTAKEIIITLLMLLTAGTAIAQNKRRMEISIKSNTVEGKEVRDTIIKIDDKILTNLKAKNVTTELSASTIDTIQLVNYMRKLIIKPSKDNKIRISTIVYYDEAKPLLKDEQYIKQANITPVKDNNVLQLQIGSSTQLRDKQFPWRNTIIGNGTITDDKGESYSTTARASSVAPPTFKNTTTTTTTNQSGTTTITSLSPLDSLINKTTGKLKNLDVEVSVDNTILKIVDAATSTDEDDEFINKLQTNDVEIQIPVGKSVVIKSKYGNVQVIGKMQNLEFDLVSCSLELPEVVDVKIKGQYSNITADIIKIADLDLRSGTINIRTADSIRVKAEFANINIQSVMRMRGTGKSSNFDVLSAGVIKLGQSFGSLRITTLKEELKLNATNTELKLFNIMPTVKNIEINNRFATITMPLQNVNNYQIGISGKYSSIFGLDNLKEEIINNEKNFFQHLGSVNLNIKIVCPNCTTDFR